MMEAQLITAPGDGVAPAVLLTLGADRRKAQYLFNVPEGVSRLVLEHRIRPTINLRAAFCTDLLSMTGMSGLIMRLRGEGHGQLHVLGPLGTLPVLASLRHFVHWRHPAVLVSELAAWEEGECYADEHVAVAPLWRTQHAQQVWKPPPWLEKCAQQSADSQGNGATTLKDGSSSDANASSSDDSSSADTTSSSSDASSSEEDSSSSSSNASSSDGSAAAAPGAEPCCPHVPKAAPVAPALPLQKKGGAPGGVEVYEVGGRPFQQQQHRDLPVYVEIKTAKSGPALAGTAGSHEGSFPNANGSGRRGVNGGTTQQQPGGSSAPSVLAFVCHIKATGQVLVLTDLRCQGDMEALQGHAAVQVLRDQPPERVAAVIHSVAAGLGRCARFAHLAASLPGPHLVMECPGVGSQPSLGFLASARTTARLNLVSSTLFPLPFALYAHNQPSSSKPTSQHQPTTTVDISRGEDPGAAKDSPAATMTLSRHSVVHVSQVTWAGWGGQDPTRSVLTLRPLDGAGPGACDVAQLHADLQERPQLAEELRRLAAAYPHLHTGALPPHSDPYQQQQQQQQQQQHVLGGKRPPSATADGVGERGAASNKRAASDLRARLQGQPPPPPPPPAILAAAETAAAAEAARHRSRVHPLGGTHTAPRIPPPPPPPAGSAMASVHSCSSAAAQGPAPNGPVVVFLGTGCAEPSKHRAASGIHLITSRHGPWAGRSILMDCGDGTLGQLMRLHGPAKAAAVLAGLACVWVSHRHADHMAGVLSLLAALPANRNPPLLLVGPRALRDWLAEATPALGLRYAYAHCSEASNVHHWANAALRAALGLTHLACVPVRHCSDAYGLVLSHVEGWNVVYSGDTQPCHNLVAAGAGTTLLIHEATFEPAMRAEAARKHHSTTDEALEVAVRMGAYRTVLTHFSQRYPKFPEGVLPEGSLAERQRHQPGSVAVAFDGMHVPLAMLAELPGLMPAAAAVLESSATAAEGEGEEGGGCGGTAPQTTA